VDWRPTIGSNFIISALLIELSFTSIVISQQCNFLDDLARFLKDNKILKKLELGITSSPTPEMSNLCLLTDEMKIALKSDLCLHSLSFNSSQLCSEEFEWIAEWLSDNTTLLRLNLENTRMNANDLGQISEALKQNTH
jgi:hypothetical protein